MLIKVRDFRDLVIKEITKAIEENAYWFDKNTKKHYTRVNPDKHEVKFGEYTSYRSVENNNYVFSINAKDFALEPGDTVNACLRLRANVSDEFLDTHFVVFATKMGLVKKTSLRAYSNPRSKGIIAININEGDEVVDVRLTNGHNELILADRNGRACRFDESNVRTMGRVSTGVRGMMLDDDGEDEVVGMIVVNNPESETVMVVSQSGYGKRSQVEDYRKTHRGGKGVKTLNITDKTGKLVAIKNVTDDNDLMIINKSGIVIRLAVCGASTLGATSAPVPITRSLWSTTSTATDVQR